MIAIYGVFDDDKIVRLFETKKEAQEYLDKVPEPARSKISVKVKYIRGPRPWEQGFWMPVEIPPAQIPPAQRER